MSRQSFDAAISRLRNAIAAGADVAFLEGVENEEQVKQAALLLAPTPLLVNLVVGGSTPVWSAKDCEKFGAKVAVRWCTVAILAHCADDIYTCIDTARCCTGSCR